MSGRTNCLKTEIGEKYLKTNKYQTLIPGSMF